MLWYNAGQIQWQIAGCSKHTGDPRQGGIVTMPSSNGTPIPEGYKRCSKGERCIHPEGPVLPITPGYFHIVSNHGKRVSQSWCWECERARRKKWNQSPGAKAAYKRYSHSEKYRKTRKEYYHKPETLARQKARRSSEEFKKHRREYGQRPEVKDRINERRQTPEYKTAAKARQDAYSQDPDRHERKLAYMKVYSRTYRERPGNKEREADRRKVRVQTLRGKAVNAAKARRRDARKCNLPNNFTSEDMLFAMTYFHGVCAYCGNPPSFLDVYKSLHAEHFIPISDTDHCPGTVPENMLPACQDCNLRKNSHDPVEWLNERFGKRKAKKILAKITSFFVVVHSRRLR